MKSIVKFIPQLAELLIRVYGQVVHDRVVNACQGAMNDPKTVTAREKETKRGAVKGGMTFKSEDGSGLNSKDMTWSESTPTEYTAKQTAPIEFVKLNDSLSAFFKKCGQPSRPLDIGLLSAYHLEWLEKIALKVKEDGKASKPAKKSKAPKLEAPAPREDKPAKSNGHAEPASVS